MNTVSLTLPFIARLQMSIKVFCAEKSVCNNNGNSALSFPDNVCNDIIYIQMRGEERREEDLSSRFSIVLTHALSHTTTHYWSWMAACTSWTPQLYTNNLSTYCDPNEVFHPDKHFTTFTLEGDETVLAITVYLTGQ